MPSPLARRLYADQVRRQGPAYANLAGSIEAGTFDHQTWVAPALKAIDEAHRLGAESADEDEP